MKPLLVVMLALAGCGSAALRQERLADARAQLGDGEGAAKAARRAAALREGARVRAAQQHGRLWHDLAMD